MSSSVRFRAPGISRINSFGNRSSLWKREPRFSAASRAGERHEARSLLDEQRNDAGKLDFPSDQLRPRSSQRS